MNTFLGTSGLKVTSIETASIDGSIDRMNSGRYRSGGGDRAEWVYQTLRVWYNALDPENLRPSCIEAARSHAMPSARAGSVAPARARWRRREAITPAGLGDPLARGRPSRRLGHAFALPPAVPSLLTGGCAEPAGQPDDLGVPGRMCGDVRSRGDRLCSQEKISASTLE